MIMRDNSGEPGHGSGDFEQMVADHMEAGFLENIADMLKRDKDMFYLIGFMINDKRQRVRIGAAALVEMFLCEHGCRQDILGLIPAVGNALRENPDPAARADAAYVLSVIKDVKALPFLEAALNDPHPLVREIAGQVIGELGGEG